jgi:hypothetical protein
MFKKPFNKEVGELRTCRQCKNEFYTHKPIWSCKPCINANVKKYQKGVWKPKDTYPFSNKTTEASNRFSKIRTRLSNAWKEYKKTGDRTALTEHFNRQLKEIEENGIMDWINDRKFMNDISKSQPKTRNRITNDYPNMHDYYEY